jgi:antitoxin component of MazEF toxin-antitoxin module
LISVGNSQAIILPKNLVEKYKLDKVTLHEVDEGILIKPVHSTKKTFQEKLQDLKINKTAVYARMKAQAEDPETISYYENATLPEIDLDILDQ